ncbi:OmpA family protein [Thalassococcus lentus]|uniref:OmpA family protein n=1 Tax=Thalassococcus lentus TaxID=1210524 RepID=A0ABT4XXQ8_9RHOB|nr:OmpA family protein [Thalassococcus lentus]MDA7426727.1 OmpA family protein [Thalassococcus lentus]
MRSAAILSAALALGLPMLAGAQQGEIFIPSEGGDDIIMQKDEGPKDPLAACLFEATAVNCSGLQVGDSTELTFENAVEFELFSFDLNGGKVTKVEEPPAKPLDYAQPKPPADKKVVLPAIAITIEFDYNSADIRHDQKGKIASLVRALQDPALAGASFAVIGHTDAKGSFGYNCGLSDRRAGSVTSALQGAYVDVPLYPIGFGEYVLKDTYNPHAPVNRRVTFMRLPDIPQDYLATGYDVCGPVG